jgi:hypothetical protein
MQTAIRLLAIIVASSVLAFAFIAFLYRLSMPRPLAQLVYVPLIKETTTSHELFFGVCLLVGNLFFAIASLLRPRWMLPIWILTFLACAVLGSLVAALYGSNLRLQSDLIVSFMCLPIVSFRAATWLSSLLLRRVRIEA